MLASGSERFDVYMERCLYGPEGFYSSGRGSAGRRRDFITSPEVGPLFGAVLANALDEMWRDLGQPDPFPVVDIGSGPGALVRALGVAAPECSAVWDLHGLDRADPNQADWPELENGVIIANELLDNLSFRIVENSSEGLVEVWVVDGAEDLRPTDAELDIPVGTRAPLLETAGKWVDWATRSGAAHVLVFDYGMATTAQLAERGGWLRTYTSHNRGSDPYVAPGSLDITCDIALDQLPTPHLVSTQAEFLTAHGIEGLVSEGKDYWRAHAAAPDVEALLMRSRVSEAEALLDADGLGGWLALRWDNKLQ